ncbi:MAG: hypothetical protein U9R14_01395 [Patescibacteria group bacterium]|nr:hypothetical protein [Patescibacteria group bacterium]
MQEIKQINKASLAHITALIFGLLAFFVVITAAIFTIVNIVAQKDFAGSVIMVVLFNIGAGLLLGAAVALIMAFFGWLIGCLAAMIYNIFARRAGGIKVELVDIEVVEDDGKKQGKDS